MPLWRIFHPPYAFSPAQKAEFAQSITALYTASGLPAFYVNVIFIPVAADSFYISGKPASDMVRIAIEHIAIHQPSEEEDTKGVRARMMNALDEVLKPYIAARGNLRWEYHVSETPRDLWKVQGLRPPPWKSEEEKVWQREDKALAWEGGELKGML